MLEEKAERNRFLAELEEMCREEIGWIEDSLRRVLDFRGGIEKRVGEIRESVMQGERAQTEQLLKEALCSVQAPGRTIHSGVFAVDAYWNMRLRAWEKEGVRASVQVTIPQEWKMDMVDFGLLMDEILAYITADQEMGKRNVTVEMRLHRGVLIISAEGDGSAVSMTKEMRRKLEKMVRRYHGEWTAAGEGKKEMRVLLHG